MAGLFSFAGSASELPLPEAPALELPEPMEPVPEVEPDPPAAEPEALPLMPALPLASGDELELLELPGTGVLAPGAELELLLELPGAGAVAPGADLELELELPGAVLEPVLDEEVPGRVASLDFCGDDGPRSQPAAASAIATAAATRVR